jgi:acylphosphatase
MEKEDTARLHATVHGKVQGVNFRYFVSENARRLGLTGWVRNRFNGTVEVLAEGKRENLDVLIKYLHKGSKSSHVTKVDHEWQEASGEFNSFRVRMTS